MRPRLVDCFRRVATLGVTDFSQVGMLGSRYPHGGLRTFQQKSTYPEIINLKDFML
jgi:hypothetical protein